MQLIPVLSIYYVSNHIPIYSKLACSWLVLRSASDGPDDLYPKLEGPLLVYFESSVLMEIIASHQQTIGMQGDTSETAVGEGDDDYSDAVDDDCSDVDDEDDDYSDVVDDEDCNIVVDPITKKITSSNPEVEAILNQFCTAARKGVGSECFSSE